MKPEKEIFDLAWKKISSSVSKLVNIYCDWLEFKDKQQLGLALDDELWEMAGTDEVVEMIYSELNFHNYVEKNSVLDDEFESECELNAMEYDADMHSIRDTIKNAIHAVKTKNRRQLLNSFDELSYYAEEYNIDFYEPLNDIDENREILRIKEARIIYASKEPEIIFPEVILPVQIELIQRIKKSPSILHSISPRAFEELIGELFDKKGFNVKLTKQTRDGGIDIIAIQSILGIDLKYIIECKRYSMDRKVGLDIVQRLYGVKIAKQANKAILVKNIAFYKRCNHFCETAHLGFSFERQ